MCSKDTPEDRLKPHAVEQRAGTTRSISQRFFSLHATQRSFFLFYFVGWVWAWVHFVRRPLIGLLYQPRMSVEQSVEWELAGKTEVRGENIAVSLCPPQIPHDLTWARTLPSAVGSRSYSTNLSDTVKSRSWGMRLLIARHPCTKLHGIISQKTRHNDGLSLMSSKEV
jgi:hypothetical protein